MRMMTVSQKNAGGQQESVSLVMVSAKGRVAVYDVSLKLTAAFTLRLSFAPVASIKAPLSNPSAPATATGTSGSKRATTAAAAGHNATSSQKVFFFIHLLLLLLRVELQCAFHRFHVPLLLSVVFFPLFFLLRPTCEKNVMISFLC